MPASGHKHLDASVSVSWVLTGELTHLLDQWPIAMRHAALILHRGSSDRQQRTRAPLRSPTLHNVGDLLAAHFPRIDGAGDVNELPDLPRILD